VDRQLVGTGAKKVPFDANEVAEVEQLEDREVALADRVLPDVRLDLRLAVRDGNEVGLAEAPDRQDPTGSLGLDSFGRELVGRPPAVRRHHVADGLRPRERVRVGIDAKPRQRLEIGAPLRDLIGFLAGVLAALLCV
jgi:hypothetical protein